MLKPSASSISRRTHGCNYLHNNMDLEGITREELQEAAAELQHLQTMALQGANFMTEPTPSRQSQPQANATRPPILEVPLTPSATSTMATPTRSGEDDSTNHPSKYTRNGGKGPEGRKGQDRMDKAQEMTGRGQRRPFQPVARTQNQEPPRGSGNPHLNRRASGGGASEALVSKMAQLMLRHEDFITGLSQSTSWVLFEGTAPPLSAVGAQARLGQEWHRMKRDSPESISQPLRTILFQTWAAELKNRLEAITRDQASKQQALGLQAMEEPDLFPYKKWNATHRALENIPNRTPLTLKEVLTLLNEAIILVTQEGVLVNYHANRRLQEEMLGPTVTFSLVLGLREPKAFRMWSILETLQSNASLMLVATTLRRERRARSQLAQSMAQDLRQLSLASICLGLNL